MFCSIETTTANNLIYVQRGDDTLGTIPLDKYSLPNLALFFDSVNSFIEHEDRYDFIVAKFQYVLRTSIETETPYYFPSIDVYMWNDYQKIPHIQSFHFQNYLNNDSFENEDLYDFFKFDYNDNEKFSFKFNVENNTIKIKDSNSKTIAKLDYENEVSLFSDIKIIRLLLNYFYKTIDII